jgi:ferrous iron transport protein A
MQLGFKRAAERRTFVACRNLAELCEGQDGVIDRIELPNDLAMRLMELGFVPGSTVKAGRCAPGGDPRVFCVDGSEIALRNETAAHLILKL